ncbi:aminotransferase class I/II-fold pyridoxal phosphate-dependent enzyme [Planococcus sp. YIM B11945]|uniref:aminotransferase class I/II-fold pyridoxal phosphate-dependent enzyme n=1 Tax=Planococcus sp. YIM B11945 TaxID=3435410 RepID=UPI003D7C727C
MTQRRPLVEALLAFQKQRPISFHVPGHKHGRLSNLPEEMRSALLYDLTELTGLDDLHYAEEAIEEAQQLLAETYGSDQSFFLVNGSTVGNLAMVQAVCQEGDEVIVQRNAHKSIFHALELAKVRPIYLAPEWDASSLTAVGVSFDTMKRAIDAFPKAKAVVLTYPNYYGMAITELKQIIYLCHQHGLVVLVDEAHGAHFQAGMPFPHSSLALGADAVVHSAHKTLPAMTMGSFLHLQGTRIDSNLISKYLHMFQSSSPSYPIMASLDDARAFLQTYSQPDIRTFQEKRQRFIDSAKTIPSLAVIETDDPLKLLLRVENYSGYQLQDQLEQNGIYAELADPYQVLLILPLLKQQHVYPFAEIRSRLKEAVLALKKEVPSPVTIKALEQEKISVPELSFEEMNAAEQEWISYTQVIGRISATMVVPYPPGVPLVVAGEIWTTAKLESLLDYLAAGAAIQGEHRLHLKQLSVIQAGRQDE